MKRLDYIDTAKGILIVLVVVAHIFYKYENSLAIRFIYAFHMPAFFIISGILTNHTKTYAMPLPKIIYKKATSFLIPLFAFEALAFIVQMITKGFYSNLIGFFYEILTLNFWNSSNWFLFTLFFVEIIFSIESKYIKPLLPYTAIGTFFLSYAIPFIPISRILICHFFFVSGYIMYKHLIREDMALACGCAIVLLALAFYPIRIDIGCGVYSNPFVLSLSAFTGTYALLTLSKHIPYLDKAGEYSLYIMGLHSPIINLLTWLL